MTEKQTLRQEIDSALKILQSHAAKTATISDLNSALKELELHRGYALKSICAAIGKTAEGMPDPIACDKQEHFMFKAGYSAGVFGQRKRDRTYWQKELEK